MNPAVCGEAFSLRGCRWRNEATLDVHKPGLGRWNGNSIRDTDHSSSSRERQPSIVLLLVGASLSSTLVIARRCNKRRSPQPRSRRYCQLVECPCASKRSSEVSPHQDPSSSSSSCVEKFKGRHGWGLRASCDLDAGSVVMKDAPILVRDSLDAAESLEEHTDSAVELFRSLSPGRRREILSFFCPTAPCLEEQWCDSDDPDDRRFLRIMQVCATGLPANRTGLFRLAALTNHSCRPNAIFRTTADQELRIISTRAISKGEEITTTYLPEWLLLTSREVRRRELQGWQIDCTCDRCREAIDDSSAFQCTECMAQGSNSPLGQWRYSLSTREWLPCTCCGALPPHDLEESEQELAEYLEELTASCADEIGEARSARYVMGMQAESLQTHEDVKALADQHLHSKCWMANVIGLYKAVKGRVKPNLQAVPSMDHWCFQSLADLASEVALWRGDYALAIEAAQDRQRYISLRLASNLSYERATSLAVEAAAFLGAGNAGKALHLFEAAAESAGPLHSDWDDDDLLVPYIDQQIRKL